MEAKFDKKTCVLHQAHGTYLKENQQINDDQ